MRKTIKWLITTLFSLQVFLSICSAENIDELMQVVKQGVSGDRARDYTVRLWQYDKWCTLPVWKKSALEAQKIMKERGLDEAKIVDTPADGVTQHGTWTNPVGWDVKRATLEVIEPRGLPDKYRFLCNYLDNPTSLNSYSCPTPPEGIETELVLLEKADPKELAKLDARGKIILVSEKSKDLKRYLDKNGILGIVSDQIEPNNKDFINENQWQNGWTDVPGGWALIGTDSKKNFGFLISQKKGNYLRNLLRQGKTIKVRAKIDSRYYTDDTLPYVTGGISGSGSEGEDVLIVGHLYEWGANDNSSGSAAILEAVGTLNDLIRSGVLPRPRRSIHIWLGHELYGTMAYTVHNLEMLRKKTICVVCCDTPADNYDLFTSAYSITMNFNACPSFTDAVFPEIVKRFHNRYAPFKLWKIRPFMPGLDNFFGEPLIGVPINAVWTGNGYHLHHNSMDTIEKVDPRSLRDLSILNAVYLYYMADAGYDDLQFISNLVLDRAMKVILEKTTEARSGLIDVKDGKVLGEALADGTRAIEYYTDLQKRALQSIERIIPEEKAYDANNFLSVCSEKIDQFGKLMCNQLQNAVKEKSKAESIKVVEYIKKEGSWEKEAARIIPKRTRIGTLTLDEIPPEEWVEVTSSPRWWAAKDWAAASYFWCDGKRNLNQIKELMELEAGEPVSDFDLIKYYRFLDKYGLVEFVK